MGAGHPAVELMIEGDIRYDDKVREKQQEQNDAALREQLLNAARGISIPMQRDCRRVGRGRRHVPELLGSPAMRASP